MKLSGVDSGAPRSATVWGLRIGGLLLVTAALGWRFMHAPADAPAPTSTAVVAPATPAPQAVEAPPLVNSDATEVFQRAFWKRPAPGDKILHAERREWAGENGIKKWNWFIEVEPSPELLKHLRADNAFNLVKGGAVPVIPEAPKWFSFPAGAVEVLQAPRGGMCLVFSGNVLFATDAGAGFRAGAPEAPTPPPRGNVASGRLPSTAAPPIPPSPTPE